MSSGFLIYFNFNLNTLMELDYTLTVWLREVKNGDLTGVRKSSNLSAGANSMVTPFSPDTLRGQITAHLLDAILNGELRPGQRIVESKLAPALRVSKGTLREALQELEHKGLVTKFDNRGTYITKLGPKEIEEIYDVRAWLEPRAAVLAHQRVTPEHCATLTKLIDGMRAAGIRRDFTEISRTDLAFHQLIWKIADNKVLERALTIVATPLFAFYVIGLYSGVNVDVEAICQEHLALIAQLRKGGPKEVKKVFEETIELFRQRYLYQFQGLQDEVSSPVRSVIGQQEATTR